MDSVVHFEIPADDMKRAEEFYKKAFGWGMNHMEDMSYTMCRTCECDENQMPIKPGAINGGIMKRDKVKAPVIVMNVENIDEGIKRVEEAGGKMVTSKMKVGDMGMYSYCEDTEGNVIGLWQNLKR